MGVRSKVETITPEKAEKWLGGMGPNRHLREHMVKRHAESMTRGEWRVTGEAVKFDTDGRLLDGQHRLHAVVLAQVPVEMLVVRGLEPETINVMDTGLKRSLADALRLKGEVNPVLLASVLVATIQVREAIDSGQWPHQGINPAAKYPTHSECMVLLEDEPDVRESVTFASNYTSSKLGVAVAPTVIGGAHYHLSVFIDDQDAEAFFHLLSGIEVQEHSPVWKFRRRFAVSATDRPTSRRDQFAFLFKTWNYWRAGETPSLLIWRPGGSSPEQFPEPK